MNRVSLSLSLSLSLFLLIGSVSGAPETHSYRYFRLDILELHTSGHMELHEMIFLDENDVQIATSGQVCGSPPCCSQQAPAYSSYTCDVVFDGDRWSLWNAAGVGSLTYDFGTATTVSAYMLYRAPFTAMYLPITWVLDGSNDNANWVRLSSVANHKWNSSWSDFDMHSVKVEFPQTVLPPHWVSPTLPPYSYRYFKLDILAFRVGSQLELFELAFLDENDVKVVTGGQECGSPPCCSQQAPAYGSYTCDLAFDGVIVQSGWHTTGVGSVTYDFGTATLVSAYLLHVSLNRLPVSWTLDGSDDNLKWDRLSTVTDYTWDEFQSGVGKFALLKTRHLEWGSTTTTSSVPCSFQDSCSGCRDGSITMLNASTGQLVDGGGHCFLTNGTCVDVYTYKPCFSDVNACPVSATSGVKPEYLEPVWYQDCSDNGRRIVQSPGGCSSGLDFCAAKASR